MILHLDFETRSDIELTKQGLHNYARGRNTDIMCAAFAFGEEPVQLWTPGGILPDRFIRHIESGGEVHAHNAAFEQELCNNVATRKYNWPHLYTDQLVCTMAMSYAMGLPGGLGATSAALGLEQQKDLAGKRLMLQYCVPREIKNGKIVWWDDPDSLKRIYEYCRQDVVVEREIGRRMMRLSAYETEIWRIDQKINSRGIAVDVPAIKAAIRIVEQEKERLMREMQDVTGNKVATCTAVQQIKTFLINNGVPNVESLAKADVVELLDQPTLPKVCRTVLELRKEAGKSSTAKLESMLLGASSSDNRLRGMFQYSGANTRRWAGRRVQLQNFPRPKIDAAVIDKIISNLDDLSPADIDTFFGPPMDVISNCLRGFLIASPGNQLLTCDYSSIEARVIAWLAGEEGALEIFRTHGKIYEYAAAAIFDKDPSDITDKERQVGKVAVLALGYGGGVGAFRTMAKGYNVDLQPALSALSALWARATGEQRQWVESSYLDNHKRYEGITHDEYIASDLTKTFWRLANPAIVKLWAELERNALAAVKEPGEKFGSHGIYYKSKGSFLWCQLPSGGVLCYPYPQVGQVKTPWGQTKTGLTYMSEDGQSKKWLRFKTYGGSLAENVTQAVARDLLADALLRLEAKGYPVVAHVHDEIVCERKSGEGSVSEMAEIMSEVPDWAKGLPIKAAGWQGKRYRK